MIITAAEFITCDSFQLSLLNVSSVMSVYVNPPDKISLVETLQTDFDSLSAAHVSLIPLILLGYVVAGSAVCWRLSH